MSKYNEFREKYQTFIYKSYDIEETTEQLKVTYHFAVPGLGEFAPKWVFPKKAGDITNYQENGTMLNMIFSLGMVELISYWKTVCPPTVLVEAGALNEAQTCWWKKLYFHGLGEFFYTNNIPLEEDGFYDDFMTIVSVGSETGKPEYPLAQNDKYMIPVGGGKDSAVTIELLKKAGKECVCYIINPRGATIETVKAAGFAMESAITPKRTLDKFMIELNKQGCLNGHTPYSAIVSFSATIAAYMHGLTYIALSNESSANESTVLGSTVNHQYSKSFEYEKDFHEYEKKYLRSGTYYFSMLRPLSEFQIGKYFATCKQYHPVFRSCNVGSKEDIWCGHCPKCLFVTCILSPFLSSHELHDIFGVYMLDDLSMHDTLWQLIGMVEEKPFECVGSRDEVNMSLTMAIAQKEAAGEELPVLLQAYKQTALYEEYAQKEDELSGFCDETNLLPQELFELVKKNCVD
ncbi:MAG: hypothetical protein E7269_05425 [Lachnospiraceae bacterium]|nr:hypothetical protein [Lachnospiraceae bacterium]